MSHIYVNLVNDDSDEVSFSESFGTLDLCIETDNLFRICSSYPHHPAYVLLILM